MTTKMNRTILVGLAAIGLLAAPAMAQELLLNGGFESGYTTNWTLETGTLNGTGLGESPHTGTKAWHGAWNTGGSNQTTTYYQDKAASESTVYKAEMWCKADGWNSGTGVHNYTKQHFKLTLQFLDASNVVLATYEQPGEPDGSYHQLKLLKLSPSGTATARVKFTYTTESGGGNDWWTWNIDDMSLQAYPDPVVTTVAPGFTIDNGNDTPVTVYGYNLTGVTAVKIKKDATELSATNVVVAGDGLSLTATMPTNGAAYGLYDVIVEKTGFTTWTLAKGFAVRNPATNLLINGGFETGAINGDLAVNGWASFNGGWGGLQTGVDSSGSIYNPGPTPEGTYRLYERQYAVGDVGAVQSVSVVPGEYLTLNWAWGYGDNANPNTLAVHQVGVFKGALAGVLWNPDVVQRTVGGTLGSTVSWTTDTLSFQVPPDVYAITISLHSWMNYTSGPIYATYWDAVSLTSTGGCGALQHSTIAPGSPAAKDSLQNISVTITGANLNQVNGTPAVQARIGGIGGTYFNGTISGASYGSLTADFTVPGTGWPLGTYDIITYQTGCTTITTPAVFEVTCQATSFASVDTTTVTKWDGAGGVVQITINGDNLDLLETIRLYQPVLTTSNGLPQEDLKPDVEATARTIPGTVVSVTPTQLVVDFNFFNKTIGSYDLEGTRSDTCGNPATLAGAVQLVLPAADKISTALANGDFEGGTGASPNWTFINARSAFDIMLDGTWAMHPYAGSYFAGHFSSGTTDDDTFEQVVGLPSGAGYYDLVLAFQIQMSHHNMYSPSIVTATIIADEGLGTQQTSSVTVYSEPDWPYSPGWIQASVDFSGDVTTSLKVKFDSHLTWAMFDEGEPPVSYPRGKTVIDDVVLYNRTGECGDVWADSDKDQDVDQADFAVFQACYSGTGARTQDCRCMDPDDSGTVDQIDLAAFEVCASGSGVESICY